MEIFAVKMWLQMVTVYSVAFAVLLGMSKTNMSITGNIGKETAMCICNLSGRSVATNRVRK
jgi:hypothetical protein